MVKKTTVEPFKAETWSEINTAIEVASREELLESLRNYHKRVERAPKA